MSECDGVDGCSQLVQGVLQPILLQIRVGREE